jgi:hypothetical protein
MIISARIESSTARWICASLMLTPPSAAFAAIFSALARTSAGKAPVSASVRSSAGVGGQSGRAQLGPCAARRASRGSSPSARKNSAHCASTLPGSSAWRAASAST